jgi:hypothetical protein
MIVPLRELDIFGVFVAPAAAVFVICTGLFLVARWVLNQLLDLNRYVWRRPLVEIAFLIVLYCVAILTMRPG